MSELTAAEKKWFKKVQTAINSCPSERVAFFTVGDRNIVAYDADKMQEIEDYMSQNPSADFCNAVQECDALFSSDLTFKNPVESTAG